MTLPTELLDILVCPRCKRKLLLVPDAPALDCSACALRFPVRDGIPIMLIDEADGVGGPVTGE